MIISELPWVRNTMIPMRIREFARRGKQMTRCFSILQQLSDLGLNFVDSVYDKDQNSDKFLLIGIDTGIAKSNYTSTTKKTGFSISSLI